MALARAQYYGGDPEFVATAEKAVALDPTNVDVHGVMGILLTAYGDDVHGLELVARAKRCRRGRGRHSTSRTRLRICAPASRARHWRRPTAWKRRTGSLRYVMLRAAAARCGDEAATAAARLRLLALSPNFEAEGLALIGYWRFDPALERRAAARPAPSRLRPPRAPLTRRTTATRDTGASAPRTPATAAPRAPDLSAASLCSAGLQSTK